MHLSSTPDSKLRAENTQKRRNSKPKSTARSMQETRDRNHDATNATLVWQGFPDTKRKEKNKEGNRKKQQLTPGRPRRKRNLPEMEEKLRERKSRKWEQQEEGTAGAAAAAATEEEEEEWRSGVVAVVAQKQKKGSEKSVILVLWYRAPPP